MAKKWAALPNSGFRGCCCSRLQRVDHMVVTGKRRSNKTQAASDNNLLSIFDNVTIGPNLRRICRSSCEPVPHTQEMKPTCPIWGRANSLNPTPLHSPISKGAPGFECRTGGPGGEASEGLKKFTKVRLKFYFWSPMAMAGCMGHRDRRSASLGDLSALYQAKKNGIYSSLCATIQQSYSQVIAWYPNSKNKGKNVYG